MKVIFEPKAFSVVETWRGVFKVQHEDEIDNYPFYLISDDGNINISWELDTPENNIVAEQYITDKFLER